MGETSYTFTKEKKLAWGIIFFDKRGSIKGWRVYRV